MVPSLSVVPDVFVDVFVEVETVGLSESVEVLVEIVGLSESVEVLVEIVGFSESVDEVTVVSESESESEEVSVVEVLVEVSEDGGGVTVFRVTVLDTPPSSTSAEAAFLHFVTATVREVSSTEASLIRNTSVRVTPL